MNTHSNVSLILDWLFITSCKGVLAVLLVLLLRKILAHRITAQGRYLLWLPAIICFLMPFGWHIPYPALNSWSNHQTSMLLESQSISVQPAGIDLRETKPVQSAQTNSDEGRNMLSSELIKQAFIVTWLLGSLTLSLVVIRNVIHYLRIRNGATQIQGLVLALFNDCQAIVNVSRNIELRESSAIYSPIITGWWRPVLLLPEQLDRHLSHDELRHVFLHELCHVKRMDLPMNWPMALVQVLNWFNPLVWYVGREFRTDMEAACDAQVLGVLKENDRPAYGHTLIKLSESPATGTLIECGAGIMERYSQLKARINMINQFDLPTFRRTAIAVLALSMIAPLIFLQPTLVAASGTVEQTSTKITVTPEVSATTQSTTSNTTTRTASTSKRSVTQEGPEHSQLATSEPDVVDQATTDDMQNLYLKVEHANATDLAALARPTTGISLLSNRGSIAVDTRTNSLLVHDKHENIEVVKELVARLDVSLKKVMIEAKIVIVDNSVIAEIVERAKAGKTATNKQSTDIDARQVVSRLGSNYDVNAEIAAIQAAHKGELISSPRVLTEVRREAILQQGIVVPHKAVDGSSGATPQSTRLLVSLKMQPDITPENNINLNFLFSRESTKVPAPGQDRSETTTPIDDQIKIITSEMLRDGETVMLADNLEQHAKQNATGKRLLIFLTPKIMDEDGNFSR